MYLHIEIESENAAFETEAGYETARILRAIADRIERGETPTRAPIRDVNGNSVGAFSFDA